MLRNICAFDQLETRRHLSAVLRGSTLFVNGEGAGDQNIHVSLNTTADKVQVAINSDAPALFDKAAVRLLNLHTRAGNDAITIDSGIFRAAWIYAGNGTNTVTTGSERDFIYTGTGADVINAGGGNDYVVSGAGIDHISVSSGNDQVWAGAGNDVISGGAGNDLIYAQAGNDTVDAGSDNDTVHGGDGSDTITGGSGDDRLWGQGANDNISGGSGNDYLGGIVGAANTLIGGDGQDTFFVKKDLTGQTNDFVDGTDILHPVQPHDDSTMG